jgi:RNA ligase
MKYDINTLNEYVNNGLLVVKKHPNLPLFMWNYSRDCQFNKNWDDITMNARPLITDDRGVLIAKGMTKFFNIEELPSIPNEEFDVYEKMDGSLGILFYYEYKLSEDSRYNLWFDNNYETGMERFFDPNNLPNYDDPYYVPTPKTKGEWIFTSKGSFTSNQSVKGCKLLEKYKYSKLHPDYTYIFEIIYPENRIVCSYDFEDLVLLGMIHTKSGYEVNIHSDNSDDIRFKNLLNNIGINIVKKYDGLTDIKQIKSMIGNNREGFVIKFHQSGIRAKIKSDEYVRLHRLLTNFSNVDIWECLKNKTNFNEFLDRVPDEFDVKVKNYVEKLKTDYWVIEENCNDLFDNFKSKRPDFPFDSVGKKEYAMWVKEQPREYQPILFSLWDRKDYSQTIWRMLKPEYQKPFWNKEIE